jgi:beta-phosphoglucomutase-like phosphatase (HAD superfamily)
VSEFLFQLKQSQILTAIGSSSVLENIKTVIDITKLESYFDIIITGADVKRGKPDPEVFLKCAERLNIPPQRCVVFEDAHVGIQAAKSAGMIAIAVTTTHPRNTFHQADAIVDSLAEITIDLLRAFFH